MTDDVIDRERKRERERENERMRANVIEGRQIVVPGLQGLHFMSLGTSSSTWSLEHCVEIVSRRAANLISLS